MSKAIADACQVCGTSDKELTETEDSHELEKLFDEDQELQQLINGEICMKAYSFGNYSKIPMSYVYMRIVKFSVLEIDLLIQPHELADTCTYSSDQKIILSGSFNPLHDGHLKLLEVASRLTINFMLPQIDACKLIGDP